MINRSECNRALSKVIAYINCGKPEEARRWFYTLAEELGLQDRLADDPGRARDADLHVINI
jgi:hypothetical protein